MAGKNSSKEKAPGFEAGQWQKKVRDQAAELRALKAERGRAQAGLGQWGRIVDSTLAQIAVSHGAMVGKDAWELVVPLIQVFENARDYAVTTAVTPDKKSYIVRVERKKPEENGESM